MKKSLIPIAVAMVAALTVVSCKNNRKAQVQEPTQEEIQEMKLALADSVLAKIDAIAEQYISVSDKADFSINLVLSDEEKMFKPDYLLDPSLASTFVTKNQKITALAYYLCDYSVRVVYDMPLDASKEAIVKLAAEVNFPTDVNKMFADLSTPASEIIRQTYTAYKKRNELSTFWRYFVSLNNEIDYLIAKNPELLLGKITEEQLKAFNNECSYIMNALYELADYDEEIFAIVQILNPDSIPNETFNSEYSTIEGALKAYQSNKDQLIGQRNALLQ